MTEPKSLTKTLTLNTGAQIPQIGLGTWQSEESQGYNAVLAALKDGYRHIDTARAYENEEFVGRALNDFTKETGVPRSEIFVTTKAWCSEFRDSVKFVGESLKRLNLDYVDLLLMHWPVVLEYDANALVPRDAQGKRKVVPFNEFNYLDAYKGMEKLVELGMVKAIGVSNFNIAQLKRLLSETTIKPAVVQVELHPYLPQEDLLEFCKNNDIVLEAYSPLGSSGAPLLKEAVISKISKKYSVTPATVVISWGVQRGTVLIPKSTSSNRIVANRKTITLSKEDMNAINDIHKTTTKRFCSPDWGVHVFDGDAEFNI